MIQLDQIEIAAPCKARWDEMDGTPRARFCDSCSQNVFNISEMTAADATALIARYEGHCCVRLYRRPDGTIITKDCPKGIAAVRERAGAIALLAATFVISLVTGCAQVRSASSGSKPLQAITSLLSGQQTATMGAPIPPITSPAPASAKPARHAHSAGNADPFAPKLPTATTQEPAVPHVPGPSRSNGHEPMATMGIISMLGDYQPKLDAPSPAAPTSANPPPVLRT